MPERQPEVLLEADVVERIRTIFLQPRPHVSIAEGTALLGWTRSEMAEAIRSGEIEVERTCVAVWIGREQLMAKALEAWPLETIEAALGAEAGDALPDSLRLTSLHVRLPRHHVAMLEHLAERRHPPSATSPLLSQARARWRRQRLRRGAVRGYRRVRRRGCVWLDHKQKTKPK